MKVTLDPDAESLRVCEKERVLVLPCKIEFVHFRQTHVPWIVRCGEFEKFRYVVKSRKDQHWQNVAEK